MSVCLIKCPSPFLIDDRVFPPLGLMAVGTYLKSKGHEVTIYDGYDIPMNYSHYGLGPVTPEYGYAKKVLKTIKEFNPSAKVIIGGPHATISSEQCWEDGFDNVIEGFVEHPTIDRSLVDIKSYKYFINGELATTMMTSYGCPYSCGFCCKTCQEFKLRDADEVIEEIRMLHDKHGYKALMFFDDIFILNKYRTEKVCECLRDLGIVWRCFVRGDLIVRHGREFVGMMRASGCVEVGMGIESGSDKILSIIDKGETVDTIRQAITLLKNAGIRVKGFFILGLPGESVKTLSETEKFLEEVRLDDMDIRIYQPYPGTKIWNSKDSYDIEWKDMEFSDMFYKGKIGEYHGNISTSAIDNKSLVDFWKYVEMKFKYAGNQVYRQ